MDGNGSVADFSDIESRLEPDDFFYECVKKDYKSLSKSAVLDATPDAKELLLMQSMQGRAINGWRLNKPASGAECFTIVKYPNTTIEDCIKALDFDVEEIHIRRQRMIKDIRLYLLEDALNYVRNSHNGRNVPNVHAIKLLNRLREPLGGITLLHGPTIKDPAKVIQGAIIGGFLDNAHYRTIAEQAFGISMHKGICLPVHLETLKGHGLTLYDLARSEDIDKMSLEELALQGVISDSQTKSYSKGWVCGYVELQRGFGISDDAAFVSTGLLFGAEAAYGLLLSDSVDTWDKSTRIIRPGGQDEFIAGELRRRFKQITGRDACSDYDIMTIIYLSAIDGNSRKTYPSCSQRRFVEVDPEIKICPLDSHIMFIESITGGTRPAPEIHVAIQRIHSSSFYSAFKERLHTAIEDGRISLPYELPNGI